MTETTVGIRRNATTPGPWEVQTYTTPKGLTQTLVSNPKVGNVCRMDVAGRVTAVEADAALISAAPDLLKRLREVVACYYDDHLDRLPIAEIEATIEACRSVERRAADLPHGPEEGG